MTPSLSTLLAHKLAIELQDSAALGELPGPDATPCQIRRAAIRARNAADDLGNWLDRIIVAAESADCTAYDAKLEGV